MVKTPSGTTGSRGNADTPEESAFKNRRGAYRPSGWLGSTSYVATKILCLLVAVLLAIGGINRAGVWLLVLPVFDLVVLSILAALITAAVTRPTHARVLALYIPAVACAAYACGLLFGWYRHTFAPHADLVRAIKATLLLLATAYVSSVMLAMLPLRTGRERRGLLWLIVGGLLPILLLLVTSLTSFYHTMLGFVRTAVAVLFACHLTYEFAITTWRPHRLKFILDLTLAFTIDLTAVLLLLLGA